MSAENVAIVRRAWDVFGEGYEQNDLGAVFDQGLYAPACTITVPEVVGTKPYVGRDGLLDWLRTWPEDVDEWSITLARRIAKVSVLLLSSVQTHR